MYYGVVGLDCIDVGGDDGRFGGDAESEVRDASLFSFGGVFGWVSAWTESFSGSDCFIDLILYSDLSQ